MLIEDNPGDITLIEEYLLESGLQNYELFVSRNLAKGKEILSKEKIDIILLDLILPDSIGFETFEKVYQDFSHLPIIVLTGVKDEQMGIRSVKLGAQNFLSKFDLSGQLLGRSIQFAIEQKQLLLKLERAQNLAKVGNWELNLNTNILTCSSQILKILEKEPKETISLENYLLSIPKEDQKLVVQEIQQVLSSGGSFEVDHRIAFEDHREKFVNFRGKAILDQSGNPRGLVGTIQDITERKEIETLKQEKELVLKASRLRQEFLAKTSHEVRTPLNPILLLTNLLLESELTDYQREQLSVIKEAGETLLAVVNDILDISKIEAGKIDFVTSSFSINQVFAHIEDMMAQNAKEKNLKLIMSIDPLIPPKITGDHVRLNQILLNLVGNAIKFTREGQVEVHAKAVKLNDEKITILFFVRDTGIGIPRDKLKWVFESFQQIENETNQKSGGTGLGLTIVKQLVTLQGGKISVDSGVGEGSEFKIELEFGVGDIETKTPTTNITLIEKEKLKGLNVLLVEDNELNQMVTRKLLTDWGIVLDIANNGREGIQRLNQNNYDLILMDVQMPEMDGYEATRYIRSEFAAPKKDIPIIALTATALSGIDDECRKAGMDDFISKPIEVNSLFAKIAQYATLSRNLSLSQDNQEVPAQVKNLMDKPVSNYQSSQENTENSAPIPPYTDLSYLKEISGGDDHIIKKTIEKFLETTPDMLRSMDDFLDNKDFINLGRCAHKLKSSVAFMGIDTIKDTILEIEGISKNGGNEHKLPQLVNRIRQVIEDSYKELQTDLATI
ncbi:MAG: response regulator [Bacteroidia bacterium]